MRSKPSIALLLTLMFCVISASAAAQALTGTKTIGTGGDYSTFTAAINALNSNGVGAGGVTFNVTAGATFAERPPAITATGTEADQIIFRKYGTGTNPKISPTGTSSSNEAGIIISGGDYFTFDGIDINSSAVTSIEHGYIIRNASATNGAQHNTLKNFTVTLSQNNSTSAYGSGVIQSTNATYGGGTDPTAQSGANDYNRYFNFSIQNSASGIVMLGGTYKDQNCEISTTDSSIRNTLNNLGNTNGIYSYGIYIFKGAAFTISNCDIATINGWGDNVIGINLIEYALSSTVSNNSIRDLNNTGTSTSFRTIGINTNHIYAGNGGLNIYNNTISDLRCASSGPTTTTKVLGVKLAFGESNEVINLFHNTISIGYGRSWDFRSVGVTNYAISSDISMKGNIVANYATNTGTSSRSYCITAARKYLGDGETDYNLYYCKNGYLGSAEGWDAIDLAAWQSLVQFNKEANSVYGDPYLIEPNTNLHGTGSKAIGQPGYTLPAYITLDMDYEARGIPTAIGADTYNPIDEDSDIIAPITQVPAGDLIPVANTALDALEVLKFRMSDSGGDGYETKVTTVKIKNSYIWNSAVWTTVLQGALLKVNDVSLSTATAVITDTDITFTIPEGDFNIADGTTVDCGLFIYFKTIGIEDNKRLKFMISQDAHGFTNAFWGSRFPVSLSGDIVSNDFNINVVVTQLQLTHPSRDLINRQFNVIARAVDANGMLDTDYTAFGTTISLHTGTGSLSGTLNSYFNNGSASWNISYNKYEWIKLLAETTAASGVTGFIQINPYIEVSSGPIPGAEISWHTPFIYNFYYGRSVSLYTFPEVNGYYSIEALSWNVASTLNTYYPLPVKIFMKPYNGTFYGLNSFTTWENLISGATMVYNGSTNAMNSTGWKKINLDTVFNNQSNTQSILVFVESNQANYYHSTTPTFVGNYLNSQDYHYTGSSGSSSLPSPFNVSKLQFRPHIRFWVTSQGYYEDTVTEQSSTATVSANSTNQQIIRVNVQTGGSLSQQTINSISFNTSGTTDASDITAARVFYTGASATFSTTTQYGSTVSNPGSKGAFTVSSNINVSSGNHYFWLVYDIGANPGVGDQFDAQCTAVSVNNIQRTPSVTDPAGYRSVAGKKVSYVNITQIGQGTTSSGAGNLALLQLEIGVYEASDAQSYSSLPLNSISIKSKNTNDSDVSAAKLYLGYDLLNQLGTNRTFVSGSAVFSALNYELPIGTTTIRFLYDVSGSAGAGNVLDAKVLVNAINIAGDTYPATEQDPIGQYTVQNFNYGAGYADQGGYYFANTLADPAPSKPTFNWIDISSTGTNAYPDMSSDSGAAPNNAVGYNIGFSFPYFGQSYTKFWIGADGAIYFSQPTFPPPMGINANVIGLYAADFHPASPNYPKTILYQNVGDTMVITYLKCQPATGSSANNYLTAQIILFPNGKIKLQYLEQGSQTVINNPLVVIANQNLSKYYVYHMSGQYGPVFGDNPIAVAFGQNAYMLGDNSTQNDLPIPASGIATVEFPNTGATVQFTTSTTATNLTAIRVEANPGGTPPEGILSLANRHWTINSTATTGLGNYNLTLNLSGITNLTAQTVFYLVKREHVNSAWTNMGVPAVYDFGNRTATWQISNGFSDFGLGFEENETLPVELTSFLAQPTATNTAVTLTWTTQSETGLIGYYVYRHTSEELVNAMNLNLLIPAENSSTSNTYSFTDNELDGDGTYYYWLQSVEFNGSNQFFGPVHVNIETESPIPPVPILETRLQNIYPNPFNPTATISYSLKEAGTVRLEIFNSRGQSVKKQEISHDKAGNYSYLWNADNLGSGLYIVRFSQGKHVQLKKAILSQ